MNPLLEIEEVTFLFGKRTVLDTVSFGGNGGEFIALLGANGSGKSTLLDIISGFRRPAAGEIRLAGQKHYQWSMRQRARLVSHLPQSIHTDLPFTAEQLVAMGRYPHTDRWFESDEDHALVHQAMERTKAWEQRHRGFRSLSGGERQRVLLAACLAQDASTLLLDEPSTFLDIEQQLHCFTLLREEARSGKLCIAVTHDLNLALTYCTRLIVLASGAVKLDIAACQARKETAWLALFSSRLRMGSTPEGAAWIWYQ